MTELERWLEQQLAGAPESLRARVLAAARSSTVPRSPFPLPQGLQQVGDELLKLAQSGPAVRETALTLLAADALITLACEVAAES